MGHSLTALTDPVPHMIVSTVLTVAEAHSLFDLVSRLGLGQRYDFRQDVIGEDVAFIGVSGRSLASETGTLPADIQTRIQAVIEAAARDDVSLRLWATGPTIYSLSSSSRSARSPGPVEAREGQQPC